MSGGSGGSGASVGAPKKFVFKVPKVPPLIPQKEPQPQVPQKQQKPAPPPYATPAPAPAFKTPDPGVAPTRPKQQSNSKWKSVTRNPPPAQPPPRPGAGTNKRSHSGPNLKQQTLQFRSKATDTDDIDVDDDCQIISVSSKVDSGFQQQEPQPSTSKAQAPWSRPQPTAPVAATHRIIFQGGQVFTSSAAPKVEPNVSTAARVDAPDLIGDFPMDEDDDDFQSIPIPEWMETKAETSTSTSTTSTGTKKEPEPDAELDPNDPEAWEDPDVHAEFDRLSKYDPLLLLYPLREVISIRYQIAARSDRHLPETRVQLAHTCLTYIERLVTSNLATAAEIQDPLTSFEIFLRQILILCSHSASELSDATREEIQRLLDRVWLNHVAGDVDFLGGYEGEDGEGLPTRILNLLLENSPSYLEDMLAALMKTTLFGASEGTGADVTSDNGPLPPAEFPALLRLCQSNPDNFKLVVFDTLYEVWRQVRACTRSRGRGRGHEQTLRFVAQLLDTFSVWSRSQGRENGKLNPWSVYPTNFHPILEFLATVEKFASGSGGHGHGGPAISLEGVLAHNAPVQNELLRLINALLEENEDEDRAQPQGEEGESPTLFFLYTNSTLIQFLGEAKSQGLVTGSDYPYLWKAVYGNSVLNKLISS